MKHKVGFSPKGEDFVTEFKLDSFSLNEKDRNVSI